MTNKKFQTLSPAEKRIAIAKDVLSAIKKGKRTPVKGSYLKFYPWGEIKKFENIDEQLQKFVDKETCECCALGACLLSVVKFTNDVVIRVVSDSLDAKNQVWQKFNGIFTPNQLHLIEQAFEGSGNDMRVARGNFNHELSKEQRQKANNYFDKFDYYDHTKRLVAIMENIIKNKGTFKP